MDKTGINLSKLRKQYSVWQDYMEKEFNEARSEISDTLLINIAIDLYAEEMKALNERNLNRKGE